MPALALTLQGSRGHLETDIFKPSVLLIVISLKIRKGMFLSSSHLQHFWGCAQTGGQWPPLPKLAGPSVLPPVQPDEEGDVCEQSLSSAPLHQPPFQLWNEHPEHPMCIRAVCLHPDTEVEADYNILISRGNGQQTCLFSLLIVA